MSCVLCEGEPACDDRCLCTCHADFDDLHTRPLPQPSFSARGWIQTYSGKKFYPLAPLVSECSDGDIAHALSNICRFTGHTREFYSVAQHCVLVAEWLAENWPDDYELQLGGLVHDASEAYLADIASPVKKSGEFGTYRSAERVLEGVLEEHFALSLTEEQRQRIHAADLVLLATEARDLMSPLLPGWDDLQPPWKREIKPLAPKAAKREWLYALQVLRHKRSKARTP